MQWSVPASAARAGLTRGPTARATMLGILLKAAVVLVAVVALPAPTPAGRGGSGGMQHQDDGGPSAYPNEPALAIGLISGSGLRRRSARLATLDQDFSSNAYDFADGGAEQRFRRQTRPGIVSPFGQTSDVEDEHRLRRADEGAAGGEDAAKLPEGSGQQEADVDGAHFPAQRRQNDDEDDLEQDSAVDRRRRGVADDEDDVYRDLDDPALPSWARGRAVAKRQAEDPVLQEDFLAEDDDEPVMLWARDSDRARRQVGEDLLTTPDSDEADYLRQRREEGAATTTVSTATDGVTETEPSEVSSAPRNGGSEAATSASDVADKQAAPAVNRETTVTPADERVNASDGATEAAPVTSSAPSSTASVLYTIVQDTSSGGSSDPSSSSSSDSSSSSSSSTSDSSSSSSSSSSSDSSSSSSSGDHKRSVRSNSASIESEESPEAKRAPPRPRERRSPQRGRFDGYVLSDFSGFRVGRSARTRREAASDVEVVKMLLEAPIDESILGELPVRRPRQIEQLVPAQVDGVPVTYLVPLPAAPEDPSVVAVSSAPQAPQEPAPAPFSAPADATNLAAGQKVLQIYTVHSPTETPVTTTTPTPAPVAILVPQAAVSNILVPASNVHVDIVPADDAANMTGSVQPALLLEPAVVSVDVPPPGPGPEATPQQAAQVITLDLPAQSSPVLPSQDPLAQQALQQDPQDVPQVMVAQTVPAAPQDVPQVMVAQNEQPAAPQASQDPLAQQAPQDVPQVMADQPVPAALQTSSPRPFAPAEPAWEQAPAAAVPQEQMAPIYVEPSVQLPPMGFSLPTVDPPGMLLSPPSVTFQGAVPQSGGPRLSAQVQADAAAQSAAWGAAEDAAQRNAEAVEQAAAQGAAQGPRAPQGPLPPRQYFDMSAPWTSRPMGPVGPPTILEKTIQMYPDGSYMYSYETADGVRVAEAGVLKKVPAAAAGEVPDPGAVGGAEAHTPGTRVANSVSGGYSYTAPDGTYFSLRYVADENGFRPIIGEMMDPMASAAPVQAKK